MRQLRNTIVNEKAKRILFLPKRFRLGIVLSALVLVCFVLVALFANYIAPHNPLKVNLANVLLPPYFQGGTTEYLLGTDDLGRDILSRIIYGARVSLIVAAIGIFLSGGIGSALGVLSGYKGGWVDTIVQRVVDVMLGFPTILLALVLAIVMGASMTNVIIIITLTYWARYARQARGETLSIRERDYVTLARIAGCSDLIIMLRHILPNVLNSLIVMATFNIGTVITLEASLSFLGAGIPPPTPSWGSMISGGRNFLTTAWWISFPPGLAITMVVLSANLFGDWVRDRLDPKLRHL